MGGAALDGGLASRRLPEGLIGAMLFMLMLGPVEESGWRGLMLPLLQRRMAPLRAGLLVGVVWGVWHLPAFFLGGTVQSSRAFMPFFLGLAALSLILTALSNDSRGSLLLPALPHFQASDHVWPDAQPWDMGLFGVVAAGVLWVRRNRMLSGKAAATDVVPLAPRSD